MAKKDEEKTASKKEETVAEKKVETKYPFSVAKGKSLIHGGKVLTAGSEVKKEMFGRSKDGTVDSDAAEKRMKDLLDKKIIVKS